MHLLARHLPCTLAPQEQYQASAMLTLPETVHLQMFGQTFYKAVTLVT